ncbi:MAG: asparagine synthase (glutamine-hydrolyzing) [Betaproteobacteria bacterium]
MCGIHGIHTLDGSPASGALLSEMGRITLHRGPDDEGQHIDGACAIGMRRLSIIDLAGGHQPLSSEDGMLWVVCNGEIYNFRELRAELQQQGYRFKTGSDCEVLLYLYAEHGDEFVKRLNGMFGFALWDARRRRLLIGRDRLGVKPIYILRDHRRIAFASEAKALLALPGFRAELDLSALDSYLGLGYVPAPQSIFRGVEKLPPATLLIVENGRVEQKRYWQLSSNVDRTLTESQWTDAVRARLEESVRMQMVSDVPIGAFLSGGIDSSCVVAFMAAQSERPIKTYSIGFTGGAAENLYNELPFARRVSELFRTDHREIVVKPDVVSLLPRLVWHMDEPIADTAFVTTYLVSEFARRDVTVILSGVGGDELFGGYRRYLGNHYQAYFEKLPHWLRGAMVATAGKLPSDRHSRVLNMVRLGKAFLESSGQSFEERYRSYVQVFSRDAQNELLKINGYERRDALDVAFGLSRSEDGLNRMLGVDAETQLPDDLLLLTDKMSMAVSLECRVPLLDHELVELAARIPESIKVKGGELKHVLKSALKGTLPDDILYRKKRGFGTPMGAWLKRDLAPVMQELLSKESVNRRGLFDHAAIARLIADHASNRVDGTDRLLSLLNLEIWSRIYLDGRDASDVTGELTAVAA